MSHYHDPSDLKLLGELKTLAPEEFKGFVALDAIVGKDDGAIPRKYSTAPNRAAKRSVSLYRSQLNTCLRCCLVNPTVLV
jgi:hypothetical protein